MFAIASEAARNPHLAQALLETITKPRRSRVTEALRLAIARGELPATLDMDLALHFLAGPLAVRTLITRQPAGPGYLERLADMVIAALEA